MPRFGRWVTVLALAAACGCSWGKRPYTNDPLLVGGRGVWGDPSRRAVPDATDEPAPPPPPVTSP